MMTRLDEGLTLTEFTVQDEYRTMRFDGALIAHASSRRYNVWRWTDLNLYRTTEGVYVLEKIGASRVLHVPSCAGRETLPRFQEVYPGRDPDEDEFEYDDCVPDVFDFPSLRVEADRPWFQISEEPSMVVNALMRHRGASRWLPRASTQLLTQAADVDPAVRAAYRQADIYIA